jgi:hypothetical protein
MTNRTFCDDKSKFRKNKLSSKSISDTNSDTDNKADVIGNIKPKAQRVTKRTKKDTDSSNSNLSKTRKSQDRNQDRSLVAVTASMRPDDFRETLDIIKEVFENREELSGDSTIQLYAPAYVKALLRRVASTLSKRANIKIPKGVMFAALIYHGIGRISNSEEFQEYARVSDLVDNTPTLTPRAQSELFQFLHSWKFTIVNPYGGGLTRIQFRCCENLYKKLSTYAEDIGISSSSLGTICLMAGCIDQPGIHTEFIDKMEETLLSLMTELLDRASYAEVGLKSHQKKKKPAWMSRRSARRRKGL